MTRWWGRVLWLAAVLAVAGMGWLYRTSSHAWPPGVAVTPSANAPWAVAILGDSDSHSYHDRVSFPAAHGQRGGAFHDITWQWGEVLSRLRGPAVDLGAWGRWGSWWPVALAQDKLGWGGRAPVKEDFEYNFAQSGAGCNALMKGRMAPRLVSLMDSDPGRWRHGMVVIRIGINDFGTQEALQALSVNPQDPQVQAVIAECVGQVRQAVDLIHAHHPTTKVVLVGMFNNAHWSRWTQLWQSAAEQRNIVSGLDRYDQALRGMVAQDKRLAFFDDRAWFDGHWGGRDEQGRPAYRTVTLGGGRYQVANTEGDHPSHTTLVDGHAGLVWNLLWTQSLVRLANRSFDARIADISDEDIVRWLDKETAGRW